MLSLEITSLSLSSIDLKSDPQVFETVLNFNNNGLIEDDEVTVYAEPGADADKDGLTNYEEIFKYKTNPLVADTDGDGYNDKAEIEAGYNPNGPGKLAP